MVRSLNEWLSSASGKQIICREKISFPGKRKCPEILSLHFINKFDVYAIKTRRSTQCLIKNVAVGGRALTWVGSLPLGAMWLQGKSMSPFLSAFLRKDGAKYCLSWFDLCWNCIPLNPEWSHPTNKFSFPIRLSEKLHSCQMSPYWNSIFFFLYLPPRQMKMLPSSLLSQEFSSISVLITIICIAICSSPCPLDMRWLGQGLSLWQALGVQ